MQSESEISTALAEDTFLADDLLRQLMGVGEVDLLVGMFSQGNGNTASHALHAIERSFQQHFTRQRAVIVNVCGGDKNEGDAAAAGLSPLAEKNVRLPELASLRTVQKVTADFSVPPSPGMALRTILAAADLLRSRACAVVSPGTTNLTPDWIANLLTPVYREKFDFVAPLYTRHKFQGLLARNLLYPMSRAIFGCRIRELYSEEWGFSGRLAAVCLNQDVWHEEPIRTRPEAWMAISAISSDFRCCQVFREPTALNRHRIFEMFRTGVTELEPILSSILDPETHAEIKSIASGEEGKFRLRSDLWVRTVYDFAASYHHAVINRDHLVQALAPLYRGMTFSFLVEHSDSSPAEMEAVSERLCVEFERQKPYLREKWKAKVEVKS